MGSKAPLLKLDATYRILIKDVKTSKVAVLAEVKGEIVNNCLKEIYNRIAYQTYHKKNKTGLIFQRKVVYFKIHDEPLYPKGESRCEE